MKEVNKGFIIGLKTAVVISILVLFFAVPSVVTAETENHCLDQESWKEWDALIQKYPNDMDVQTLHALRLGLCAKIERGDLTVEKATEIFERFREVIIKKKQAEIPKEKKDI
jgi:hypothetical protein